MRDRAKKRIWVAVRHSSTYVSRLVSYRPADEQEWRAAGVFCVTDAQSPGTIGSRWVGIAA